MRNLASALLACSVAACGGGGANSGGEPAKGAPSEDVQNLVPKSSKYSNQQMQGLTLCTAFGDVVFHTVKRKAAGGTLETELEKLHSSKAFEREHGQFLEALVKDLYNQPNQPSLDVLFSFYEFCAADFAAIPKERPQPAKHCLLAQHLSLEAYYLREQGKSREDVLAYLKPIDYAAPIVERAYAFDAPEGDYVRRMDLTNSEFQRCFAEAEVK